MVTTDRPNYVDLRIESGQPGTNRLSIHITPEFAEDLAMSFGEEGAHVTRDIIEHSVPETIQLVLEVTGPIAASGATLAKVLKEWWHRNDAKKATVTFNGESISMEGMSVEQMTKIIDKAHKRWDKRWRKQFRDRFPGDDPAEDNGTE